MANPILDQLQRGRRPANTMFDTMMAQNPQFRDFVARNKDKTPEQICKDYGIDPKILKNLIR